jgi:tetratricopeptide (TPR) repeat protein
MKALKENKLFGLLERVLSYDGLLVLGAILLLGSPLLGWLDQPVRGLLRGYQIQISQKLPAAMSYGSLCMVIGASSLVSLCKRFRGVGILAGCGGFIIGLHFLFQLAVFESKNLIAVHEYNVQEKYLIAFSNSLPTNFMEEPTFDPTIPMDTIFDRVSAAWHYTSLGWYATVLGSLFLIIACAKTSDGRIIKATSPYIVVLYILVCLPLSLWPYMYAEFHRSKGDSYLASGMYTSAIEEYEDSKRLDPNINYSKSFHVNMGRAYYFLNRTGKGDYFIYQGVSSFRQNNFEQAIFYFKNAITVEPDIAKTVGNSYLAWTYARYGLSEYKRGIVGSAIDMWKKTLEIDSNQLQAYYYLSRAYYDRSAYQESLMAGLQFFRMAGDKINQANICCNLGDSYYRLKNYDAAREQYLKSLVLVLNGNQRALMNLIGR